MTSKMKMAGMAVLVLLVIGFTTYVFTAPYNRFPGVRIGGTLTPAPADWRSIETLPTADLKLAGLPPFVVHIFYVPDATGLITATRPDNGYWGNRLRDNPNGYLRVGDKTYALKAEEILGTARIPYLEAYGGKYNMSMGDDFEGEVIVGSNEPLNTWEVFYWTAR